MELHRWALRTCWLLTLHACGDADTPATSAVTLPEPIGPPLIRVRQTWDAVEIEGRLGTNHLTLWQRDQLLLIAVRSPEPEAAGISAKLTGSLNGDMEVVVQNQLWAVAFQIHQVDQARLAGQILFPSSDGPDLAPQSYDWRGPRAPPKPPAASPLNGRLETVHLDSPHLPEGRDVTVYHPPGSAAPEFVLYCTDGERLPSYSGFLDHAVTAGQVPRVLVVGAHSARGLEAGEDPRSSEYLAHRGAPRFLAHAQFFCDELVPHAEATWQAPTDPAHRAVYGVSAGAEFAIAINRRYSDRFPRLILFSLSGQDPPQQIFPCQRAYFAAGHLEPGYRRHTQKWQAHARRSETVTEFRESISGHDSGMWQEELPAALAWIFQD